MHSGYFAFNASEYFDGNMSVHLLPNLILGSKYFFNYCLHVTNPSQAFKYYSYFHIRCQI